MVANQKYQTYDVFKVLYISHVKRQAASDLQYPSIEHRFSGRAEYIQTLKTTDLVVVVDDVKRDWNSVVFPTTFPLHRMMHHPWIIISHL